MEPPGDDAPEAGNDAERAEELEQWRQYVATRDPALRAKLLDRYLPFARFLAGKLYARRLVAEVEFDDYLHYAVLGLIEAIDRYDPARKAQFRTYAAYRILGSILNNVSHLSERHEQLALRARLRRERAEALGEDLPRNRRTEELFEQMVSVAVGLALGYMLEGSGMLVQPGESHQEDAYTRYELRQIRETIQAVVELLPERQRTVIKYHYYYRMTVEQIGERLGVTKGRVSQIHRQALTTLRDLYARAAQLNLRL